MSTTDRDELKAERDFLLSSIRDLDRDRESGTITDDEYQFLRDQQTVRAAEVIRVLDGPKTAQRLLPDSHPNSGSKPAKGRWERQLWIAGVLAFVMITAGVLASGASDRLFNDSSTGSIEGDSNTLLRRAQEFQAQGKPLDAIKAYDKVLAQDPNNVQALTYRGWLVRLAGLPNEGLKSIDRAIELQPNYPDAHFFRGFILFRDRNDPAGAVTEFQTFLNNNPPPDMVPLVQQALQDAQAQVAAAK